MALQIKLGLPGYRRGPGNPLKGKAGIAVGFLILALLFALATFAFTIFVIVGGIVLAAVTSGGTVKIVIFSALLTILSFIGVQVVLHKLGMWSIYNNEGKRNGVRTISFDFTACMFWSRFR